MRRSRLVAGAALGVVLGGCGVGGTEERAREPGRGSADETSAVRAATEPGAEAATGRTYHVATQGCDDQGPGGESRPLCSVQRGVDLLGPGDRLLIGAGTYAERVLVDRSGTTEAPIVIEAEPGAEVIIDGGCRSSPCRANDLADDDEPYEGISVVDAHDVELRGLGVRNTPSYGVLAERTTGVVIAEMRTTDTAMSGIASYDSTGIRILGNEVAHANAGIVVDGELDASEEAISVVGSTEFVIARNLLHDNYKEGIDVKVGSRNGTVRHNRVERACAVGIYINEAHDVDVFANAVLDTGWFAEGGETVECGELDTYGRHYGRWYGTGILLAVGDLGDLSAGRLDRIDVHRNLVDTTRLGCVEFWDQLVEEGGTGGTMTDNAVFNNTLVACGQAALRLDEVEGTRVVNNIIATTGEDPIVGNSVDEAVISHNLFHDTATTAGSNSIIANPRFIDPRARDYTLREDSPAIDAGADTGRDYEGARPDIGAFELGVPHPDGDG